MTRLVPCIPVLAALLVGCGSSAKRRSDPTSKPSVATAARPAVGPPASTAVSPNLSVSQDLASQCSLRFANVEQAPKFAFDQTELLPADRDVLEQIAECLTRGPLRDRSVRLVGRADPRGTDEYNLALGTRRAQAVRTYLQRLGVSAARLNPTTRGDLDAVGDDERGWQRDRRVDLQLVQGPPADVTHRHQILPP